MRDKFGLELRIVDNDLVMQNIERLLQANLANPVVLAKYLWVAILSSSSQIGEIEKENHIATD